MNRDDHVELTRLLTTLHATVALAVAAGGLLLAGGRLPTVATWSGSHGLVGTALVVVGVVVMALAVAASGCRAPRAVHRCGLVAAVLSAAAVAPLALVLGVSGWVVLGVLPLLATSMAGLVPLRPAAYAGRLGRPARHV